jgi:hypothetical protein
MPKLLHAPVTQADLIEFLDTESDFAFELRTVECLSSLGFRCSHGGSYEDPVTHKTRQFDIRALKGNNTLRLSWAVECKNLSTSYPLLVMCVPRTQEESFVDVLKSFRPRPEEYNPFPPHCESVRIHKPRFTYTAGDPVGKSMARVGRATDKERSLTSSDADIFEKWSQALASADDLADDATEFGTKTKSKVHTFILPILVVPDNTLWSVIYKSDGSRMSDPAPTDRCSVYVGQDYRVGEQMRSVYFVISHVEVVTLTGLKDLCMSTFNEDNLQADISKAKP